MRSVLAVILIVLSAEAAFSGPSCAPSELNSMVASLAEATNRLRGGAGRTSLRLNRALNRVAQAHACDLARRQVISHQDARGRRPMARMKRGGFRACFAAENVALGARDADFTVQAWQSSADHARNQGDARADAMGFGVARGADGRLWWVGVYAAPCRPSW